MNIKETVGRLARWALYLQTYTFTMIYRAGRIHNNADTLCRPPVKVLELRDAETINLSPMSRTNLCYGCHRDELPRKQLKRVEKIASKYKILGDTHYQGDSTVPRPVEREKIPEQAHLFGHYRVVDKFCYQSLMLDIF